MAFFGNYDVYNFVSCMTASGISLFQATYEMQIKQTSKFDFRFYLRRFVLI